MGKRRDARTAELIEKAVSNALAATPMQGAGNNASTSAAAAFSQLMGVSAPTGIMQSLAAFPTWEAAPQLLALPKLTLCAGKHRGRAHIHQLQMDIRRRLAAF